MTRIWNPVDSRRDHCYLTSRIRVQRERMLFLAPHKQFIYEVHIRHGADWIPMHTMLSNASHAFSRARRYATAQRQTGVTT